ncbi:hypothetical protein DOTSEDRAFT_85881 [Dothistroma septosporum NZE10]|uniref:Heterokaryon incompatibility domain-containing protein n=1 Tax=Dothistroma septosporum (strain NZE10 / CBS 128990) TaxID=675120 RepID=N1PY94_DOTSN|nr:hypothetical protein DOTSEDRAFT_85881 [Dothistroma septosporum NZE10]
MYLRTSDACVVRVQANAFGKGVFNPRLCVSCEVLLNVLSHKICLMKFAQAGWRGRSWQTHDGLPSSPCRGCDEIQELLAWLRRKRTKDLGYEGKLVTGTIHHNFLELDTCAKSSNCVACQLLRRAFCLEQITVQGVKNLYRPSIDTRMFARLHCTKDNIFLEAVLSSGEATEHSAWILCSAAEDVPRLDLDVAERHFNKIFRDLRPLVEDCHLNHSGCTNLAYSSVNPTWLVQMVSRDTARLVSPMGQDSVRYVALSYSWGSPGPGEEQKMLDWTRDQAAGPHNPDRKLFSRKLLPSTLQDALRITESFGLEYIWIDCLCIPEDSDWDRESAKMHEIFGNAYFTLAATSAERAWDPLQTERQAWDYQPRGCNLDEFWLSTIDMGLNDMRMHAPLSNRGWVLQEERLSPRILYWCAQRAYWSCLQCPYFIEGSQGLCNDRATKEWSRPQRFLELCFGGDATADLPNEWFDIVASYVRRDLYRAKDRFLAITGLATRYLNARPTIIGTDQQEEYLAGLWRGSIAHGLSWSLKDGAAQADPAVDDGFAPPSWSWASLPFNTEIEFCPDFRPSPHFTLLTHHQIVAESGAMAAVEAGAKNIKQLEVRGRCRSFVNIESGRLAWNKVCVKKDHNDEFVYHRQEQFVHSRDSETGRILSHDVRKDFVIGKLDYASSIKVSVPDGRENQILCLEIGESSMLLLLKGKPLGGHTPYYRRVGAANGYRGDFFSEAKMGTLMLV